MTVSSLKTKLRDRAPQIVLSAIILLATMAVYSQVLKSNFVMWDDDIIIYNNHNLGALSLKRIYWAFTDVDSMMRYNPLTLISWSATLSLFGLDPFGFHLGNWLLHSFSSVLLFLVIRKILARAPLNAESQPDESPWRSNGAACIATLFWALHPLRVEPVAWATDRTYCQAFFFIMMSALCYLTAQENVRNGPRYYYAMIASFACYVFSLFSYANGITFFVVLFIMDVFLFQRIGGDNGWWKSASAKQVLLEKALFALPAIFISTVTLVVRIQSAGVWKPPVPLSEFGVLSRFMQACYMAAYYVYRPFHPVDLAPVYTTLVSFDPLSFPFLLRAFLVLSVSAAAIVFRKRFPLALAVLISYVVLLFPVMGFFEHPHYHCDRYSLLPSVPFSVLTGFLLLKINSKTAHALVSSAAIALIAFLGVLSFNQSKTWHDTESLFANMIKTLDTDPYREDIYWRLGKFQYDKGNRDKATESFQNALYINPDNKIARTYLISMEQEKAYRSKKYLQDAALGQGRSGD